MRAFWGNGRFEFFQQVTAHTGPRTSSNAGRQNKTFQTVITVIGFSIDLVKNSLVMFFSLTIPRFPG